MGSLSIGSPASNTGLNRSRRNRLKTRSGLRGPADSGTCTRSRLSTLPLALTVKVTMRSASVAGSVFTLSTGSKPSMAGSGTGASSIRNVGNFSVAESPSAASASAICWDASSLVETVVSAAPASESVFAKASGIVRHRVTRRFLCRLRSFTGG